MRLGTTLSDLPLAPQLGRLRTRLDDDWHRLRHRSFALMGEQLSRLSQRALSVGYSLPDRRMIRMIRDRIGVQVERDLQNVETGEYPRALLSMLPLSDYLRAPPGVLSELPRILWRKHRK